MRAVCDGRNARQISGEASKRRRKQREGVPVLLAGRRLAWRVLDGSPSSDPTRTARDVRCEHHVDMFKMDVGTRKCSTRWTSRILISKDDVPQTFSFGRTGLPLSRSNLV